MLQINLLGVPEVCRDGVRRNMPMGKSLALLAYLAVEGGLHPREEVVALLWPHAGEQEGRTNLRSTLTMLRKALGEQPGTPAGLRTVADAIGLEPTAVLVDVQVLATAAALVRQGKAVPDLRSQLEHAVAAWHGPLLNGIGLRDAPDFETWLLGRREDAHRCMSEILARLASIDEDAGDLAAAVTALEQWVRLDALNEEAHRRLLAAHLAAGNITAGLRAYDACRTVLAMELGSEPNLEIQALAEQLEAAAHRPAAGPAPHRSDSGFVLEPPLVGRAPELVALRGCFAQAQQGQAQVVVLSGEFGIGKTRLAREFLAMVRAQGGDVLQGHAFEQSGSMPYAALVEALRPRLERENAPEDLLDDLWLAALTHVLPELCARYPDLTSAAADRTEARLFEAIVRLIHALAEKQPLVLFLDDAQWIDGATREFVQYALRRWAQCGTRVVLLLAVRAEDLAMTSALAAWLEHVDRAAPTRRLALGPLAPTATIRLIGALAGAEPPDAQQTAGESVEARFGAWLAAETRGQPFFIMETLKALLKDGALALRPDAARGWALDVRGALRDPQQLQRTVPARVQEVIMTRLGRLGQTAMALLMAGAVLGTRFTFEQVRHIAELPEREALEGLDEAVRAYLLREDGMGGYTFCYDTLRAVVSAQAGAARREVFRRRARALLDDRLSTGPWSDRGATAGVALTHTGNGAGGPIARGGQLARARFGEDQTSAALGLAQSPFPAVLLPASDQSSRLPVACWTSTTPSQHRVSSVGAGIPHHHTDGLAVSYQPGHHRWRARTPLPSQAVGRTDAIGVCTPPHGLPVQASGGVGGRLGPAGQRGDALIHGQVGVFDASRLKLATPAQLAQGCAKCAAGAATHVILDTHEASLPIALVELAVEERGIYDPAQAMAAGLASAVQDPVTATVVAVCDQGVAQGVRDAGVRSAGMPASIALDRDAPGCPATAPAVAPGVHGGWCRCCGPPGIHPHRQQRALRHPGPDCLQGRAPRAPPAEHPHRGGTVPAV